MSEYQITWVTDTIAVGYAPMSYAELDSIREQGIDAIVNLCGEYCDLHRIEEDAGFEVFFLPIPDETAPGMEDLEVGLEWLDEATYLGKKVLVHCRHGIGRTGTFVTAYLLRRGFSLKQAGKMLKATRARATPTNFSQWWLLRKFGKQEGRLTSQEPTPNNRLYDDLEPYFSRYETLLDEVDRLAQLSTVCNGRESSCEKDMKITLIEALYLHEKANITLTAAQRNRMIEEIADGKQDADGSCLLRYGADGVLFHFRPLSCRLLRGNIFPEAAERVRQDLDKLSREVFYAAFSITIDNPPLVRITDVVSGKFIQTYFQYISQLKA